MSIQQRLLLLICVAGLLPAEEPPPVDLDAAVKKLGTLTGPIAADILDAGFASALQRSDVQEKAEGGRSIRYWVYRGEPIRVGIAQRTPWDPLKDIEAGQIKVIRIHGGPSAQPDGFQSERDPTLIADRAGISQVADCLKTRSAKVKLTWMDRAIVHERDSHGCVGGVDDGERSFSGHPGLYVDLEGDRTVFLEGDPASGRFNGFENPDVVKLLVHRKNP